MAETLLVSVSDRIAAALPWVRRCMRAVFAASTTPLFLGCKARPFTYASLGGLSRGVDELTHLELELDGTAWDHAALDAACAKVDRRTRVDGGTWSALPVDV